MTEPVADFSGYATRNDLVCADGRTIVADAFKDNDGTIVPLLWQHGHNDVDNVLGHVKLENRADGVYAHAYFNQTQKAQNAKEQVRHGDIRHLSIFANQLVERAKSVLKGNIREVSLVLGGANPGAYIDHLNIAHDDQTDYIDGEAIIATGLDLDLETEALPQELEFAHADTAVKEKSADTDDDSDTETGETAQDILDTLTPKQEAAVYYLLSQALTVGKDVKHSDVDSESDDSVSTDGDDADADEDADEVAADAEPVDAGSPDEANAADPADATTDTETDASADATAEADTEEVGDAVQHDNINQEDNSMTHNVFDQAKGGEGTTLGGHNQVTLSHSDVKGFMEDGLKRGVHLSQILNEYALAHGIENIDYLFPDAKALENSPQFNARRTEWVDKVLSKVRKVPWSRIKSVTADITADEARAKGYITGNMKNEEFFTLSKRETTPQTVYKKQKLDRDDVIDITELDVVAWLKAEMKVMLDEEIAGAILIGDGRSSGDEDKIKEDNIRPIVSDHELYVTTATVNIDDASSSIEELVDATITNREFYKGSGMPDFYTSESIIAKFLTVKDTQGRRLYANLQEVANVLRVREVIAVDVLSRVPDVVGIMVNLIDYSVGTDRGGQATMFDDFDLDYNKLRYLLETRLSGALTLPKSAVVFRKTAAANVLAAPTQPAFNAETGVLTVPTITGVVYKNAAGTTLTTGSPVTVPAGEDYVVNATPASGYYFASSVGDSWTFTADEA